MRWAFPLLVAMVATASAALAEQPPPPPLVVNGVFPASAPSDGGWFVRVSGYGFAAPNRVFFELGDLTLEAVVASASSTSLDVITPAVSFPPGEQVRVARIAVESHGVRATAGVAFVFESLVQRPEISMVSPNHGSLNGGTRVNIYGEGFQQPVQILFGDAEARVLHSDRTRIAVETPAVPDLRVADVTVRNINSGTEATSEAAFRYIIEPTVSSVEPAHGGPGTRLAIFGEGFQAPVAVTVANVPAQVLSVQGTKIVALLMAPTPACNPLTGPVTVTNVETDGLAFGPGFTYDMEPLEIAAVNPRVAVAGKTIEVQLSREGDYAFTIGGLPAWTVAHNGSTYRVAVPTDLLFPTGACTLRGIEGTGPVASRFYLHVVDRRGACATTRRNPITVQPAQASACTLPPLAKVLSRTCTSRTVTIANERGRADLVITAPESVEPRTAVIRAGATTRFALPATTQLERLRFETNDPRHPRLLVCVSP